MLAPSLKKLRSRLFCGFLTLGLSGVGCTVYSDGLLTPSDGGGGDGTAGTSTDLGAGAGLIDSGGGGSSAGDGSGDIAGNSNVSGGGESHGGSAGASQGGTGGAAAGGAGKGGAAAGGAAAGGAGKGGAGGTAGSVGHAGASGAGANGGSGGHAGAPAGGAPAGGAPAGGAPAGGAPAGGAPAGGAPAGGAPAGGAPAGGAGGAVGVVLCSDHPIPPTSSWVASASHHQSTSPVTNLTDGTTARWSSGKPQAGDEWLQLDFGVTVNLRTINLQQGPVDANDYPRSYAVIVSNTALDMNGTVRASGVGTAGVTTTIVFPSVTSGRYLLIKQLGTSLSWWSVEELEASCSD